VNSESRNRTFEATPLNDSQNDSCDVIIFFFSLGTKPVRKADCIDASPVNVLRSWAERSAEGKIGFYYIPGLNCP
jgi:hypothetical protein